VPAKHWRNLCWSAAWELLTDICACTEGAAEQIVISIFMLFSLRYANPVRYDTNHTCPEGLSCFRRRVE